MHLYTPADILRAQVRTGLAVLAAPPRPQHQPQTEAWLTLGDQLGALAGLDPDATTLDLAQRWAWLRPVGALPTPGQIAAMTPMLVAAGLMSARR